MYGDNLVVEEGGEGSVRLLTPNEGNYGVIEASLIPYYKDNVWNYNDGTDTNDPAYPGLHADHQINYKAHFYPRDPFLSIAGISNFTIKNNQETPGYSSGTGLPKNYNPTPIPVNVSQWYNDVSQAIGNSSTGFTTNNSQNLYSGWGGWTFSNSTWNTTIACADANKSVNGNKRGIKDKNGNSIPEFFPFNSLIKTGNALKHASTDVYSSFAMFNLVSEGDYNIYLHSIESINPTYSTKNKQLLDFSVSGAGNNAAGTARFGYKPGHNGTDSNNTHANSSNDPTLHFMVKGLDTGFQSSEKIYAPATGTFTNGSAISYYRSGGSNSTFYPPKFLLGYHAPLEDTITDQLNFQDNSGFSIFQDFNNQLETNGTKINTLGIENNGTGNGFSNNSPVSNRPIIVRVDVPAKGSTIDFGEYFTTLKIRYYKDNYQNRKKLDGSSFIQTPIADIKIHEMRVVVKLNLEAAPLLSVSDIEGEDFTNSESVHMGNINIG